MTRPRQIGLTLALVSLLAAPASAQSDRFAPRTSPVTPALPDHGVSAPTTGAAARSAHPVFCDDDDWFYFYEEDENGNEIPGTRQYGCADDPCGEVVLC